ncbi:hypothetical protein MRX96_025643 [Rhipicephalus microplus]
MSVDRFSEIRRFLHFKDKSDTLSFQNDRVAGMRPFIDALNEAFCSAVDPEEYQFVAEMAIPLKGRSSTEQYLPSKPKRWGFKVWVIAGVSGYICRFEVYQGATGLDGGRHFPKKSEQKYASRCRSLACRSKTRYLCGRCNVPLCRECFQSFHGT